MSDTTKTVEFITKSEAREISNGIWWSNMWKVCAILGIITCFTLPIVVYAYTKDQASLAREQGNIEEKIDLLIKYVHEDLSEVKARQISLDTKVKDLNDRINQYLVKE